MRVYLAGPEVFLPDALEIGRRKKEICSAFGLTGLYPLDNDTPPADGQRQDHAIYRANRRMIEGAEAGLFNLTPFRGCSADPGTVFELGMMAGMKKPVFGYTSTSADLRARVAGAHLLPGGAWIDTDGCAIEDFGNADNLMIDSALAEAGHPILRLNGTGLIDDMDAFSACVAFAAARLLALAE